MGKLFALLIVALGVGALFYFSPQYHLLSKKTFPTYLTYSPEDLNELNALKSDKTMSIGGWQDLENKIFAITVSGKIGKTGDYIILPYIAVAQRDAAYLSYNTYQRFAGTLGPVTVDVICMFEPEECKKIAVDSDEYSKKLSDVVMIKIKARYDAEKKSSKRYEPKAGMQYWSGVPQNTYKGQVFPSLTWLVAPLENFRAPIPPLRDGIAEDKQEIKKLEDVIKDLTADQKKIMADIDKIRKTEGVFNLFPNRAKEEMKARNYDFAQTLMVMSILRMTLADVISCYSDSKFTYLVKRPFQKIADIDPGNPLIKDLPQSTNAGYPSGTAILAKSNEILMNYLFPDKKSQWTTFAFNLANKEVWAGDHFPAELNSSLVAGEKLGQEVIKQFEKQGGLAGVTINK